MDEYRGAQIDLEAIGADESSEKARHRVVEDKLRQLLDDGVLLG